MNTWERLLRMVGLRHDPMPYDHDDPDLTKARAEVDDLHRQAKRVLTDYAAAEEVRRRK